MRRKGVINIFTSISWYIQLKELHINTESGRISRPIYIVDDNKLRITEKHLQDIRSGEISWRDRSYLKMVEKE